MKELSIEEKAKAYDEALERAKDFMNGEIPYALKRGENVMCWIFPELAKLEDEKIRKALIELVKCNERGGYKLLNNVHTSSMLAWLEKQGSQIPANSAKICKDEQKSTDKVEPKFHEGEWLQYRNAKPFFVEEITKQGYVNGDSCLPFNWENEIHLWTIQDANDGDVLVSGEVIFIFNNIQGAWLNCHCSLHKDGSFNDGDYDLMTIRYLDEVYPATKEQCYTLMKAMTDAGWEFDFTKKKLNKIQQKSAWSKEDKGKLNWVINVWNRLRRGGDAQTTPSQMEMLEDWLKSIKDKVQPQSKQEWSEEDEENMNNALYILNQLKDTSSYEEDDIAEKIIVWLKSLKDRYTWKPSDEQIRALHDMNLTGNISYAGQGQVLIELYNDLKKLKG